VSYPGPPLGSFLDHSGRASEELRRPREMDHLVRRSDSALYLPPREAWMKIP